jgi:hypothetical protein
VSDVTERFCISAKSFFDGCQDCNAVTAEEHIGMLRNIIDSSFL